MPNPNQPDLRRLTPEQVLIMHANSRQEISPGLMHAFKIAGTSPSINLIPEIVLNLYQLENTRALLIVGAKKRIVWCSAGPLSAITAVTQLYEADHAVNWEGCVDLNPVDENSNQSEQAKTTEKTGNGFMNPPRRKQRGITERGFAPITAGGSHPTAASCGVLAPSLINRLTSLALVAFISVATCFAEGEPLPVPRPVYGEDLLLNFSVAAMGAGYAVNRENVVANVAGKTGFTLILPALMFTPQPEHETSKIVLINEASVAREQRLVISMHLIPKPGMGGEGHIILRLVRKSDRALLAEETVPMKEGWILASLAWTADHSFDEGELAFELYLPKGIPFQLTFPMAFVLPAPDTPGKHPSGQVHSTISGPVFRKKRGPPVLSGENWQ